MTAPTFRKQYRTPGEIDTAAAYYRWLTGLGAEVGFPALLGRTDTILEFEHIAGPTAGLGDLAIVAATLGRLHRAARHTSLIYADLNTPYPTGEGLVIGGFAPSRRDRLHSLLHHESKPPLSLGVVDAWLERAARLPAALYKDANPRNVILSPSRGPVLIDFDSLTLAPVGYDLAKLIVTTAMTYGPLSSASTAEAIAAYTEALGLAPDACPLTHVQVWAEFHHVLTRPWLGRHYLHDWLAVRPWPQAEVTAAAISAPSPAQL